MIFKKKESTQELLGIEAITDYGISTKQGELVFFSVAPTNLSVLPADSIDARINALLNIIKGYDGIEMIATDSMQSFEYNKRFYRDRLEKETCPAVRRLLEQDIEHLDRIQVMTASSRQFYIVLRIRSEVKGDISSSIFDETKSHINIDHHRLSVLPALQPNDAPDVIGSGESEDETGKEYSRCSPFKLSGFPEVKITCTKFGKEKYRKD